MYHCMWQKGNNSTHKAKNQTVKTLFFVRTDTHMHAHTQIMLPRFMTLPLTDGSWAPKWFILICTWSLLKSEHVCKPAVPAVQETQKLQTMCFTAVHFVYFFPTFESSNLCYQNSSFLPLLMCVCFCVVVFWVCVLLFYFVFTHNTVLWLLNSSYYCFVLFCLSLEEELPGTMILWRHLGSRHCHYDWTH